MARYFVERQIIVRRSFVKTINWWNSLNILKIISIPTMMSDWRKGGAY